MKTKVEYMCEDVSSMPLGQLGELISDLQAQGWQILDETEARLLPEMYPAKQEGMIFLWMKRSSVVAEVLAA